MSHRESKVGRDKTAADPLRSGCVEGCDAPGWRGLPGESRVSCRRTIRAGTDISVPALIVTWLTARHGEPPPNPLPPHGPRVACGARYPDPARFRPGILHGPQEIAAAGRSPSARSNASIAAESRRARPRAPAISDSPL